MKTTLDLPEDLMRAIKIRAAENNLKLKDLIADLLRAGLNSPTPASPSRHKVSLPLIHCTKPFDLTPEQVDQVLLDEEVAAFRAAL